MKSALIAVFFAGSIAHAQDSAIAAQQADIQSAQQMQQAQIYSQQASMINAQTAHMTIPPWTAWKVDSLSHLEISVKS